MLKKNLYFWISGIVCLLISACASIGSPDGGDYDEKPPKVLKCSPNNQAVNSKSKRIVLTFNEYIKLENATEKVVVSPPQIEMPDIRTEGKKISVQLFDSLRTNTTYTIDFSDAIVDNNESNPMGHYTYSFSTGPVIDTLEVSGVLLEAQNLEPIKGMLIGLHSDLSDSAFIASPLKRVSRTNGSGRFNIKGIAPGKYRIYALQDANGNFLFDQKSEKIAFDTIVIEPSSSPDIKQDTIWKDSTTIDSIRQIHYTHFYPENIVLKAFLEGFQARHLLKAERAVPHLFSLFFTAPSDSLPTIKGLNFDEKNAFIVEHSLKNDTLTYWIPDTTLAYKDTLVFALTYLDSDSLNQLIPKTDTIELAPKITRERILKEQQRKMEEWEKEKKKERKARKGAMPYEENPYEKEYLTYSFSPMGSMDPNQNITFTFSEPLESIDSMGIHFRKKVDSLWLDAPFYFIPIENQLRTYRLYAEWRPGEHYQIELDSATFKSVMFHCNKASKHEIQVRPLDEYSSLFLQLELADTCAIVELLNNADKVVRSMRAVNNKADFYFVKPGTYYLRTFIDKNGDGVWTTGDYGSKNQPEEVFYFPQPMTLKPKFEYEQQWDVRGIELVKQKPLEITKQKPDKTKTIQYRNEERRKNKGK